MGSRISSLLTGDPNDISLSLRGLYGYQNVVIHTAQVLGSGSYGKVVKATLDKKPCAAKILHRVFIDSQDPGLSDFISRFEQECQILRDLKHPNIVQFLGVVQDPTTNKPILLMELMKGQSDTLSGELANRHTLPCPSEHLPRHSSSSGSPAQEWHPPSRPVQQQHPPECQPPGQGDRLWHVQDRSLQSLHDPQ
ncbi:Serine/threonine-protein kinase GRIK2 [Geodia barretti]|uniref:Serine/threonine-protein kinase GRIK2 n=1 Tax=Geodia barretti TaxID=519541 RepID=A0AA35R3P0_GEOBA|nr:Serine/threonine-protein kinase GRIK2 [Geodia barretti]